MFILAFALRSENFQQPHLVFRSEKQSAKKYPHYLAACVAQEGRLQASSKAKRRNKQKLF